MGLYGFLGRSAAGAALGAWMGGDAGQSRLGGAIGGGLAGGLGVWGAKYLARRRGVTLAGLGQRGLGLGARGAAMGAGGFARLGARGGLVGRGAGYGVVGMGGIGRGLNTGSQWLGNNASTVNKYGGVALAALGMASAAHIGSSVMGSNSGY